MSRSIITCVRFSIFPLLAFLLWAACGPKAPETEEPILVQVGDKNITVKEFLYRAEFTPRPRLYSFDEKMQKQFILNSLVAEKLLALETSSDDPLLANLNFQAHIKGIKEQKMREELFWQEAYNTVELDTSDLKRIYQLAGREYDLQFYTITNKDVAMDVEKRLKANPDKLVEIFEGLGGKDRNIPEKTVKFKDPDPDPVHMALYSNALDKDQIIGPVRVEKDKYLLMRVVDWRYQPVIGPEDVAQRYAEVKEKRQMLEANVKWGQMIHNVMTGTEIDFEEDTFYDLVEYFIDLQRANNADKSGRIGQKEDLQLEEIKANAFAGIESMLERPFFKLNGDLWTVADFKEAIRSHPLVYRKTDYHNKNEFAEQFKLAVADLIRDMRLNKLAYDKKIDRSSAVHRTVSMWKDALVALHRRDAYMEGLSKRMDFDEKYLRGEDNYLNRYIDSLQQKYSERIFIDKQALDDIEVTNIDLFVMQQRVPYPMAVPSFPQLGVDAKLDYGHELNEKR